jgi:hypothetical protein
MVRVDFFYTVLPVVAVLGTAVVLTIPYLALIALLLVALAAVAGLVWLLVVIPYRLVRRVARNWSRVEA